MWSCMPKHIWYDQFECTWEYNTLDSCSKCNTPIHVVYVSEIRDRLDCYQSEWNRRASSKSKWNKYTKTNRSPPALPPPSQPTSNPNNDKHCQMQNTYTISCKSVLIASILTIIGAFSLFICVYDREVDSTLQTVRSCEKTRKKNHVQTGSFIGIFLILFTFEMWQRFLVGKCCQLATDGRWRQQWWQSNSDHKVLELYSSRSLSLLHRPMGELIKCV